MGNIPQPRRKGAAESGNSAVPWLSVIGAGVYQLSEQSDAKPSALKMLCAEAFATGSASIPAAVLQERLPAVLALVEKREREKYGSGDEVVKSTLKSYDLFVSMCVFEEFKTGEPTPIVVNA